MIDVFVTFRYGDNFDGQAVRKIAETTRVSLKECQQEFDAMRKGDV